MAIMREGRNGGLVVDRESLHASDEYRRQIQALTSLSQVGVPSVNKPEHGLMIMVTGGRDYADEDHVRATFDSFIRDHGKPGALVVGDATGADSLAKMVAFELDILVYVHYANWELYKNGAGSKRNQEMVDLKPDFCLPFMGGNGTRDCMRRCTKAGIPFYYRRDDV